MEGRKLVVSECNISVCGTSNDCQHSHSFVVSDVNKKNVKQILLSIDCIRAMAV